MDRDPSSSVDRREQQAGDLPQVNIHWGTLKKILQQPSLTAHLRQMSPAARPELFGTLLAIDINFRRQRGETPDVADYLARFPDFVPLIVQALGDATLDQSVAPADTLALGKASAGPSGISTTTMPEELGDYVLLDTISSAQAEWEWCQGDCIIIH